ncbi:MAG TPA: DUF4389 domain-containing protein [Gammaproteobacteria bacterium]|nr:DUF4389 domain-containing protein [Gammaproteobacteria bacterium]
MAEEIREHVRDRGTWLRLFYIVLFAVILNIASAVLAAAVIIQFGFVLLTGQPNGNLAHLGRTLARFVADVVLYMTFNTDDRPFPFSEWPGGEVPATRGTRRRSSGSRSGGTRSRARAGRSGGSRARTGKSATGGADSSGEAGQ